MTDPERLSAARRFFWEIMDKQDTIVSLEVAQRQIRKLAEALPPFTAIRKDWQ